MSDGRPCHPVLCVLEAYEKIEGVKSEIIRALVRAGKLDQVSNTERLAAAASIPIGELAKLMALGAVNVYAGITLAQQPVNGRR